MKKVSLEVEGTKIFVKGLLTFDTVSELYAHGLRMFTPQAVWHIDLSGVSESDSAGLALLLAWLKQAKQRNCLIQMLNIPSSILAFARICGVEKFLPIQ